MTNLFQLLYADTIIVFKRKTPEDLQHALNGLGDCKSWKLTVNANTTKNMGF